MGIHDPVQHHHEGGLVLFLGQIQNIGNLAVVHPGGIGHDTLVVGALSPMAEGQGDLVQLVAIHLPDHQLNSAGIVIGKQNGDSLREADAVFHGQIRVLEGNSLQRASVHRGGADLHRAGNNLPRSQIFQLQLSENPLGGVVPQQRSGLQIDGAAVLVGSGLQTKQFCVSVFHCHQSSFPFAGQTARCIDK